MMSTTAVVAACRPCTTWQRTASTSRRPQRCVAVRAVPTATKATSANVAKSKEATTTKNGTGSALSMCICPCDTAGIHIVFIGKVKIHGVHHVALLCESLETSLAFYRDILGMTQRYCLNTITTTPPGLEVNPDRPDSKLPYRGAWLWIGPEMIHLMELPNPDPLDNRPPHGGRDRHFCIGVESIDPIEKRLKEAGVEYTRSMSGRAAIFFRDPDSNCLECVEQGPWR